MKKTAKAAEFFNSSQYRTKLSYDVRHHDGLVVIVMDNGPAAVTQAQWDKACATRLTWDDSNAGPGDDLDTIWDGLMEHDLAATPGGKKAIAAVTAG